MKTISKLCFILAGFAFASCQWSVKPKEDKEVFKDTLAYAYKTVHERAADCGSKPDSDCTVVKVKYAVFKDQNLLNDSVTRKLTSLFRTDGKPDSSVQMIGEKFLQSYSHFKKRDPKSVMFNYLLDIYAKVLLQDSSITTLEVGGYTYQGGAHGSSGTYFINWNTKANKSITLNDIFIDGYADKLKAIAEEIFRKEEKLSDTSSLARDYFFKNSQFALNDNFSVTPIGLKFIYNQYEIKPYAAGITELFIPYSQIKTLLRPNSVLGKFIK